MPKPIYILGTGLSHDGSTCLLKDGKIIVAIEKERLSKKKHDGFNDNLTVQYCLDAAGISFSDIDLIVEESTTNPILKPDEAEKRSNRIIPENIPRIVISHHLAHAYSAVGTSPFEDMAVVVMDGQGSSLDTCIDTKNSAILPAEIRALTDSQKYQYWEKESYYIYQNNQLTPIFKDYSKFFKWDRHLFPTAPYDMEHSIAEFYGGISEYIFDEEFCDGKLMGLAPFGRPNIYNFDAFELKDGRAFIKYDWMKKIDPYLGGKYQSFYEYFQYYADLAYFAQKQIEKAIFYLLNSYYKLAPHKNLAYAGGLALNAVANAKFYKNTPYKNFYFQPAAGDNGLSIGCAYYGWLEVMKKDKVKHNGSTYFGKIYDTQSITKCLSKYSNNFIFERRGDYIDITANELANGKIVAWFQEGSEFGPRALGHRSILADPRRKDIKNFINRKVKTREDFRPFAPSVIAEDVHKYFDCDYESPYMILVAQTRPEWIDQIPAIVHKDGSARVQTVSKDIANSYYALIKAFSTITGISILLNTSLNGRSMPIVETPEDVLNFFLQTKAINILVINDFVIQRRASNQRSKTCAKNLLAATTA